MKLNPLAAVTIAVLFLLGGIGGGYVLFSNRNQTQQSLAQQITPGVTSPTEMNTPPITKNDTTSVTQNGITLTIGPTHGPPGTKVNVSIVGIIPNPNTPYATISLLAINGLGKDSDTSTYTFNTTKISQSSPYDTTYVIPTTVMTSRPGDQNYTTEVPIGVGNGNITFSYQHPTLHDISIKAPFTVTTN